LQVHTFQVSNCFNTVCVLCNRLRIRPSRKVRSGELAHWPCEVSEPIWIKISDKSNEVRRHVVSTTNIEHMRCVELGTKSVSHRIRTYELTDPSVGTIFKRSLTIKDGRSCLQGVESYLRNAHVFWLPDRCSKKKRRSAWNTASPWNAVICLNCGDSALRMPVSYGEP
jgi:hypothetical protein